MTGSKLAALVGFAAALFGSPARAQGPPPPPPPDSVAADSVAADSVITSDTVGVYTDDQANRGKSLYSKNCIECHSASAYTGRTFRRVWGSRPVFELWEQIRTTMPEDNPGGLSHSEYADIVAYLLKLNKLPTGPVELPADADKLKTIMIRAQLPRS